MESLNPGVNANSSASWFHSPKNLFTFTALVY